MKNIAGFSLLVVCLFLLMLNTCSPSDKNAKGLLERGADAFNNAEFQTLIDLTCKINGTQFSLEEIKTTFKASSGGSVKILEVLREEPIIEDEKARLAVLRIQYENMESIFYTITAPCGGQRKIISDDENKLYWGEYPITDNNENARLLNNLAWFYAESNIEVEKAINLAKKANELSPNEPNLIGTLAWVYFKAGKYENAYFTMEKLVDKKGNVRKEYASHWEQILDKLPQADLVCNIINPPNNFKTKEDFVDLEVDVTPNVYISINNSNFKKLNEKKQYTKKISLLPDENQIIVKTKKYLYGKDVKSQTVHVIWEKYRDNSDKTITDLTTGLMWAQKQFATKERSIDYKLLMQYCKGVEFDGYSDWKLPSRKELNTLIRDGRIIDRRENPYFKILQSPKYNFQYIFFTRDAVAAKDIPHGFSKEYILWALLIYKHKNTVEFKQKYCKYSRDIHSGKHPNYGFFYPFVFVRNIK